MKKRLSKKGSILIENVIFIVLNLVFLSILAIFLFSKTSNTALLEEKYTKQIALIIDSAKPGMQIMMDMKEAVDRAKKERGDKDFDKNKIVSINGNVVSVKLGDKGGYSYSFFNDVKIENSYINEKNYLVLFIQEKEET